MQAAATPTSSTDGADDILFRCEHCGIQLVVEKTAAGLTLDCQRCGKPTKVPPSGSSSLPSPSPVPAAVAKLAELERHLKENESQRTEINSYINQLSIQLHRWQLRLQTLNERNRQLAEEIAGLTQVQKPPATS